MSSTMREPARMLEDELATYERHRAELLGSAQGKFVLIHDGEIGGVYDSKMDAINQGYEKFGVVPFLVKQIVPVEAPLNFTSNLFAR
jgi:hypothetical protein